MIQPTIHKQLVIPTDHTVRVVNRRSSVEAKVALSRSLFRGRDDVYPRRFESRRTRKSGYQPACANEWTRGLCEKPRVRCAECLHRRFLPVTDEVIRWHLSGQDNTGRDFVMGVYPMLQDETCFFLAVDFDKAHWCEDVGAFLETCRSMKLPAALERSHSGNGGHIWLFFDQAIPAGLARKLGSHILTETMERRPDIGLDSCDRFFPNQDTLPQGGFGNLIALPLQKQARESGNSVFLDDDFAPHSDQWAFLSTVRKIDRREAEYVVCDAEGRGRVVGIRLALPDEDDASPWTAPASRRWKEPPIIGPLPDNVELVLGNEVYIAKDVLPAGLRNRLLRLAAFQNPKFYKSQAMRLPTYDKPRIIACAEDHPRHIGLPRGCLDDVRKLLSDLKIKSVIRDELADWSTVPSGNPGPGQTAEDLELAAQLRRVLADLPAQQAEAVCLHYVGGMTYREVARALGVKSGTVGSLLHRARCRVRELLTKTVVEHRR